MPNDTLTRREFCVNAGQALTLLSLAGLLPACGGSSTSPSDVPQLPTVNAGVVGGAATLTIDASSPLNPVGGAALVQTSSGSFLVAQTSAGTFTALTATCTHEGCIVSGFQSSQYVCPCHGSHFSTSGSVLQGPAASPLRSFATRFANGVLTITVA
ncbi:MAG TPA: Rieske (2Fe-2S) protein [Vicinamibacterales bacterium]|jgi:cytochrome b6-f complex iron-sulfur subunit